MNDALIMWLSVIAISAAGTLTHFLCNLTGEHRSIGLFTAVNESIWEHIKIAIFSSLLWGLYGGYYYGENPNYFCAKLMSLLVITIFILAVLDPITGKYGFRAHRNLIKNLKKKRKKEFTHFFKNML